MIPLGILGGASLRAPLPPSAVFDSSMLSGRTYVFSVDQSNIYKGTRTSDGLAVNDLDTAMRIDSGPGPSTIRTFVGQGFVDAQLRANIFGPGLNGVRAMSHHYFRLYARPTGTAVPSASGTIGNLVGASAKTLIFAGTIHDAAADYGNVVNNAAIISDTSSYLGLHYYKSGSNAVLQWYSYSSDFYVVTAEVPLGVPFVVACRHASSILGISVNNGPWFTTGSGGATGSVAAEASLFYTYGFTNNCDMGALVTCNANNSNANIAACCTSAGAMIGLAI